jgi:hypothetical protein
MGSGPVRRRHDACGGRRGVEEELDRLFREQPTEDYGIDAHAEVVDGEDVRGGCWPYGSRVG